VTSDEIGEGSRVSPDNFAQLLAISEHHESRHSTNADLLRYVSLLVNVDGIEDELGIILRQFVEYGGNDATWATPRCPEVDCHGLAAVDHFSEVIEGRKGLRALLSGHSSGE